MSDWFLSVAKPAFAVASLLAITTVALAGEAAEARQCQRVDGPFTSTLDSGAGCPNSPIQMCTHGILGGDLEGTYEFSFLTPPGADPNDPSKITFTGQSIVTFHNGKKQVFGNDSGFMAPRPDGLFDFQTTVHIDGGTHEYSNASGQLV